MAFAPAEPPSPTDQPARDLMLAGLLAVIALTGCDVFGLAEWDLVGRDSVLDLLTRGGPLGLVVLLPALLVIVLGVTGGIRRARGGAAATSLSLRLLLPACCLCLLSGLAFAGYGLQRITSPYGGRFYYFESVASVPYVRLHLGTLLGGVVGAVGLAAACLMGPRAALRMPLGDSRRAQIPFLLATIVLSLVTIAFPLVWNPDPPFFAANGGFDRHIDDSFNRFGWTVVGASAAAVVLLVVATWTSLRARPGGPAVALRVLTGRARALPFVPAALRFGSLVCVFLAAATLITVAGLESGYVDLSFPPFTWWIALAAGLLAAAAIAGWLLRRRAVHTQYGMTGAGVALFALAVVGFVTIVAGVHLGAPDSENAIGLDGRVEGVSPAVRTSLAVAARVLQIGVLGALAYAVSSVRLPWRRKAGPREDLRHLRLPTSVRFRLDLLLVAVLVVSIVWLPRTEVKMPEPKPLERKVAAFLPKTVDPSRISMVIEVGSLHVTDERFSALLRRIGELAKKERPRSLAAVIDASPELTWGNLIAVVDTLVCNEVFEVYYARSSDEPYRDRIYVNGVVLGEKGVGSRFDPAGHPAIGRIIGGPWPTESEPR